MTDHEEPNGEGRTDLGDFEDYEVEHPKWKYGDRKRSILTERDRNLLWGDLDLEGQRLRDAQYRIRQRVLNGLYDMEGIAFRLKPDEVQKVVDKLIEESPPQTDDTERQPEPKLAVKALLILATKIQMEFSYKKGSEFYRDLEDNLEPALETFFGPGELEIKYNIFEPDETDKELAEKLVNDNGTVKEYRYFQRYLDYELLVETMEENDVERFVVQREDKPNYSIDKNYIISHHI